MAKDFALNTVKDYFFVYLCHTYVNNTAALAYKFDNVAKNGKVLICQIQTD